MCVSCAAPALFFLSCMYLHPPTAEPAGDDVLPGTGSGHAPTMPSWIPTLVSLPRGEKFGGGNGAMGEDAAGKSASKRTRDEVRTKGRR